MLCFRGATIAMHGMRALSGVRLDATRELQPDLVLWGPHLCGESQQEHRYAND